MDLFGTSSGVSRRLGLDKSVKCSDGSVGTGDGAETTFALEHTPLVDDDTGLSTLVVKLDSVETTDYTLDGTNVTFNTAPSSGVAITADYRYECTITADYSVPYFPKSEDYVLDVGFEIQFGEGV